MTTNLNVITVKLGNQKYSADDVNRVFRMAKRYITQPFDFYCYTDDVAGLDSGIKTIAYIDMGIDPIVYNKLVLLNPAVVNLSGVCAYFDLDIAFVKNIDDLIALAQPGKVTVAKTYWRPLASMKTMGDKITTDDYNKWYFFTQRPHTINSSIMIWMGGDSQLVQIWEQYWNNQESIVTEFPYGMDGYLFYKQKDLLAFTPPRKVASFNGGVDFDFKTNRVIRDMTDVSIVLLNGAHSAANYKRFESLNQAV